MAYWLNTLFILGIAACLSACGIHPDCRQGEQTATLDTLYFGMASPLGEVRPEQWRRFVNEVVTPRFPQGLTTWQTAGQWRSAAGKIHQEATQVLQLLHPETDKDEQGLLDIINHYKTEFKQESVLRVRQTSCASF